MNSMVFKLDYVACLENENSMASEINVEGDGSIFCNVSISVSYGIRVITKLPNSEQSYKGKVKTNNYINRQNQSTTGKL